MVGDGGDGRRRWWEMDLMEDGSGRLWVLWETRVVGDGARYVEVVCLRPLLL